MNKSNNSKKYPNGSKWTNNDGCVVQIIGKGERLSHYLVQFEDGHTMEVKTYPLRNGAFKNKNHKSVYSVGYIGIGKYGSKKHLDIYDRWTNILRRCYYGDRSEYKNVTVCEEWHNFQAFAEWYEENYVEEYHIDKDVLQFGVENKVYSPQTCLFIPSSLNLGLTIPNERTKKRIKSWLLKIGR